MSFTAEEEQLMQRLRQKYGQGADVLHTTDQGATCHITTCVDPGVLPTQSAQVTDISVTVCPVCQGSGMQTELYHHRQLQRSCSHCDGEGLLNPPAACRPGPQQMSSAAGKDNGASHSAKCAEGAATIDARIQQYQQERQQLMADQQKCTDTQLVQLRANLVEQLDKQIAALQERKQALA